MRGIREGRLCGGSQRMAAIGSGSGWEGSASEQAREFYKRTIEKETGALGRR